MTEAVFDFAAINRRMNRKPEPVALVNVLPSWWTMEGYRAEIDALRREIDECTVVFIGQDFAKSA